MVSANTAYSLILLTALASAACTFPVKVGDNDDTGTSEGGSSGDEPTGEEPPGPGPCGDGVVNAGEACDDGNDDPDDGCDVTCARTGVVEWTYSPIDLPFANDLAVDATGRVILVSDHLVIAVDPGGEELWRTSFEPGALNTVEVDPFGKIYIGGEIGTVHGLDPSGEELWRVEGLDWIRGIVLGHGALYSLANPSLGNDSSIMVRRHDVTSGAVAWAAESTDEIHAFPTRIAVAGPHVVVAGSGDFPDLDATAVAHPLLAVLDQTGAFQSLAVEDLVGRAWTGAASTGDGGVVVAGFGPEADIIVQRLGADLTPTWTIYEEGAFGSQLEAAAGAPDGTIAVVGRDDDLGRAFVRRLAADGATVWTSVISGDDADPATWPRAVEFGPDCVVALGGSGSRIWLRRFALD